jgi:hypothetical protein
MCKFLVPDCLEKFILTAYHLNIGKKLIFFKSVHFYNFVFVSWKQNLTWDPDSNPDPKSDPELITDPDPNLQIISGPAGSGCTTMTSIFSQRSR